MTDEDKENPAEPTKRRLPSRRLSGHFELDLPQPENAAEQSQKQKKTFFSRLSNDLKKPRFWLEIIALVVVGAYTYQARRANQFSQQIVRSTISASLSCAASKSYSHMGSREVPMTGAFYVSCNNGGKVAAENVSGTFDVIAKTFPEGKDLWSESWSFGGPDKIIEGGNGDAWAFDTPKYSPETDPQLITDGKQVIIGEIVVSFVDETGQKIVRRFCQVEMNWANLGGSPDGWTSCQMMTTEKGILANPRVTPK